MAVQSTPAIALAARLPTAWRAASRPNAEPRRCSGASRATAARFGGLGAADPDAGEDEADGEQREAFAAEREAEVGEREAGGSGGEDPEDAVAVADVAGGDAGERRGEVVARCRARARAGRRRCASGRAASRSVARRISSVAARLPSSNAAAAASRRPSRPCSSGRTRRRIGWCSRTASSGGVADRVDDRERGEQAGDDREQDRGAHADQPDERDREQRAADRAEVVHRALEPVGAAVDGGGDDVGEQRVAGRDAQPAGGPRAGAQDRRPARRWWRRRSGRRGPRWWRSRRPRSSAGARGIVGRGATGEVRGAREAVGDPLDHPERRGGRVQRARQQAGQQRGRDLVPEIGEQAGDADPANARCQPAGLLAGFGAAVSVSALTRASWPGSRRRPLVMSPGAVRGRSAGRRGGRRSCLR